VRQQLAVAADVLQIAHQHQLDEHLWVDALLTTVAIVGLGEFAHEPQVQCVLQPAVEVVLRYPLAQLEAGEQLLRILFLALHNHKVGSLQQKVKIATN